MKNANILWPEKLIEMKSHARLMFNNPGEKYKRTEQTFCKIAEKASFNISGKELENCHQIGSKGHGIMKFSHKKDCMQVLGIKKALKYLTNENNSAEEDTTEKKQKKVYVNQSLSSFYRLLWLKCKHLHYIRMIFALPVSNGTSKIKIEEHVLISIAMFLLSSHKICLRLFFGGFVYYVLAFTFFILSSFIFPFNLWSCIKFKIFCFKFSKLMTWIREIITSLLYRLFKVCNANKLEQFIEAFLYHFLLAMNKCWLIRIDSR